MVPVGLMESMALSEEAGADARRLILLQFLRLILTISAVPVNFLGLTGHAVGSAVGRRLLILAFWFAWGLADLAGQPIAAGFPAFAKGGRPR